MALGEQGLGFAAEEVVIEDFTYVVRAGAHCCCQMQFYVDEQALRAGFFEVMDADIGIYFEATEQNAG